MLSYRRNIPTKWQPPQPAPDDGPVDPHDGIDRRPQMRYRPAISLSGFSKTKLYALRSRSDAVEMTPKTKRPPEGGLSAAPPPPCGSLIYSQPIPDHLTAIFAGPYDDNWPLCQQRCALGPRLTQITLHCFYRRLVLGHSDRPTYHVYPTSLEVIAIVWVAPEFRWSEITFATSPVWKRMAPRLFKEPPQVEVVNAAIMMDVMTGCALAQADQAQSVGISTGIFLSSAKIGKIIEGNLREASKVGSCDARE